MSNLEMTKLCAEAMGADQMGKPDKYGITARIPGIGMCLFNPLRDDAQAMALVKKFHIQLDKTLRTPEDNFGKWIASRTDKFVSEPTDDLNRAIVECVAKMQAK